MTAFHKHDGRTGQLKSGFPLIWRHLNSYATIQRLYQHHYPDKVCNFQLLIKSTTQTESQVKAVKTVLNNFEKLFDSQSNADVLFVINDQKIAAHSVIICASSPVFAARFQQGKLNGPVEIADVAHDTFRQLLRFLYTGAAPELDNGSAEALFVAADKYRVDALKDICEDYLVSTLCIENVIHYLVWGHVYLALKLKTAAIVYLVYHRYKIWNRQEWKELRRTYTDLYDEACDRMF